MIEKNMTGFALGVAAETLYNRGSVDQALIELETALQYGHHFKDPGLFIPMYLLKGRIYAVNKQFKEAYSLADYAMGITKERHWIDSLRALKAYCYLLEGHVSEAERELSKSTGLNNLNAKSEQVFWLLVHVRLLLMKGQAEDALKTSVHIKEKALRESQISTIIEAGVLEAVCQMDLSNEEAALAALHKALEQGAPYGYIRIFLDEVRVVPLVKKYLKERQKDSSAHWDSVPLTYVEQLVANYKKDNVQNQMLGLLTPRERDVLKSLAGGASNRAIASQLGLSEGTVRIYLSTIYEKIGVKSRMKAVLWAKEWEDSGVLD